MLQLPGFSELVTLDSFEFGADLVNFWNKKCLSWLLRKLMQKQLNNVFGVLFKQGITFFGCNAAWWNSYINFFTHKSVGRRGKTSPLDAISNEGRYEENTTSIKDRKPENIIPIWKIPTNRKFPKLETFRLTEDMVKRRAKDNVIIVTFGNYAFMDFILNWVKHLTDLHVFNLLVGNYSHFSFSTYICIETRDCLIGWVPLLPGWYHINPVHQFSTDAIWAEICNCLLKAGSNCLLHNWKIKWQLLLASCK